MKTLPSVFGVIFLLTQGACASKPFQPPPYEFEIWKKSGSSNDEIKRALLECGYIDPYTSGRMPANEFIIAAKCMEKDGFISKIPHSLCYHDWKFSAFRLKNSESRSEIKTRG